VNISDLLSLTAWKIRPLAYHKLMVTRSGRSVGSGQLVDLGVFQRPQDRQSCTTTAPLAAYSTAEEEDKQITESMESYTSARNFQLGDTWRARGTRAYIYGGLEAEPPAGSRGRDHDGWSGGLAP